jgi:hypothetical protein
LFDFLHAADSNIGPLQKIDLLWKMHRHQENKSIPVALTRVIVELNCQYQGSLIKTIYSYIIPGEPTLL